MILLLMQQSYYLIVNDDLSLTNGKFTGGHTYYYPISPRFMRNFRITEILTLVLGRV